jgi:hypothetical protein
MNGQQTYPMYFWMLSDYDKYQYNCLKYALASSASKNQRNMRITNFNEAIEAIKCFAIRGDKDDKLRSLVAGICWLKDGIATNTHQLKILMGKCKSSINGSLQKMGFAQTISRSKAIATLTNYFPFFKDNTAELRKWSVRQFPSMDAKCLYSPPTPYQEIPKDSSSNFSITLQGTEQAVNPEPTVDYLAAPSIDDPMSFDAFDNQWVLDDAVSFWE